MTDSPRPWRTGQRGAVGPPLAIGLLLVGLVYLGYLAIALGPSMAHLRVADFLQGESRILSPAEVRGALLRQGDRVYLVTTQQERIVPLSLRLRGTPRPPRDLLYGDLWAFDAAAARPIWRKRLLTLESGGRISIDLLGLDRGTLWVMLQEPLGVAASDGQIIADGARIERANPAMVGKRVDQAGYVAFGGQGLQLTLSDSTQWVVDGATLQAQPRATARRDPGDLIPPSLAAAHTGRLQMRGLPIGTRWLGVLTDDEAKVLQAPAVVPGRRPGERRGAAADFHQSQHVPQELSVQVHPYRLWAARVAKVSAAPAGWPNNFPDDWGTRDEFSDYQALPEAPVFLQAGLLGDGRSERPFWLRDPDSVLVLHHDKVGDGGRLHVARVAGPAGRVVWDAALPLSDLVVSTAGDRALVLFGTAPNATFDARVPGSRPSHETLVALDAVHGAVSTYDLSAESVAPTAFPAVL